MSVRSPCPFFFSFTVLARLTLLLVDFFGEWFPVLTRVGGFLSDFALLWSRRAAIFFQCFLHLST